MRPARRVPGDDTGAAALEFALVAPLLCGLLVMIFSVGWGTWEYQSVRATAQEAARLASVGIPDVAGYRKGVVCLGERNGLSPGSLTGLTVTFYDAAGGTTPGTAAAGGYVVVRLTYLSMLHGLPLSGWTFLDSGGHLSAGASTRIEQVGLTDVTTAQTLTVNGDRCA